MEQDAAPSSSRKGDVKADAALVRLVLNNDVPRLRERLLSQRSLANAHSEGYSLLMLACMQPNCNPELVRQLLGAGADPNAQRKVSGETPLSLAARAGNLEVLKVLLAVPGIKPDAVGPTGASALVHAASEGHAACVSALLAAGCNPNAASEAGDTALMHAASRGHRMCVEVLAAVPGINPNAANRGNETALMHAAASGSLATVHAVLAIPGVQTRAVSRTGFTALREAKDYDTAAALLRWV